MRRADPTEIGPVQVQEMLVKMRRALIVRESWIEDTRAPQPQVRRSFGQGEPVGRGV